MFYHHIVRYSAKQFVEVLSARHLSHMIGDERENLRINAWIRSGSNQGLFVRPRLFMPYFEEVKALLKDRLSSSHHQVELMRMRKSRHPPDIPDTLNMVSHMNAAANNGLCSVVNRGDIHENIDMMVGSAVIPAPDNQTLLAMRKRENKLRQSPMCQRACFGFTDPPICMGIACWFFGKFDSEFPNILIHRVAFRAFPYWL
ncbi:GL15761 [Drosophila persimilis]|uniref:GL15761 n=1 Tax=Drosophila persimilis TaxID=7234 RepID=B4HDD6_DROPE|nr:GL15761 [Drosophila persimilis]